MNIKGFALIPALLVGLPGPTPTGTHFTSAYLAERPDGDQLLLVSTSAGDVIAVLLADDTQVSLTGTPPRCVVVTVDGQQTLVEWGDDPGAATRKAAATRLISWAVPLVRVKDLEVFDEVVLGLHDESLQVELPNTVTGLTEVIHIPLSRDRKVAALLLESQWAVLRSADGDSDRIVPVFGGADTNDELGGPAFR